MTVGKAIFDLLLGNTDLRAIVSNRIFPEVAQQDAELPYVVYNISSNEPSDTKREPSKMDTAQVEVNLYSTSYTECIDMSTHVRAALDRVTGTYSGVNVQSIQYLGEVIDFDEAQRAYNITSDYDVRVSRSNFEIAQGSPITGVTLGELSDVDTTGVTDGQVIAYDAAAQEWQPADGTGGVTELGQLDDVQFGQGGPEIGELLKYDGSEWTNDGLVKSEIGLGNVDNTSDADKPVSTATQTELNAKANSADFSNVDNTSDADKPVSTATQTALNAKADTSAVPTDLNDLSDVSIVGTPAGNQALIYDATAGAFKSQVSYTNRFEDEVEQGLYIPTIYAERGYSVKSEGDGIFIDPSSDTPTAGKVIKRKIYHKTGFISDNDVIGDYTLIHTFADNTAYADTVAVFDAFEEGATYGVPPFTLFQTWEEVTAAPSFTGLLNETYGSGAEAAYSTRRLNGNVTECMVIRRASDSTTTTIGFDSEGNIDESAIETFCTGTSCTVSEWLDQSGNGNDATQATPANQPTIYTGGSLVKENGKVALDFDGSNDALTNTNLTTNSNETFTIVANYNNASSSGTLFDSAQTDEHTAFLIQSEFRAKFGSNTDMKYGDAATGQKLHWIYKDNTTSSSSYGAIDGGATDALNAGTNNANGITLGNNRVSSFSLNGQMQELILFGENKSSNRTSIEENVGDYFTQNTPLLDTYSGAAAAYSLRLLDSTYTGDAIEVYAGTNGTADIGFNIFGELDTVALAAHCGTQIGTVQTWYDQSGNGNNAINGNTGSQPQIWDGSGVVTQNGKPTISAYGGGTVRSLQDTVSSDILHDNNEFTQIAVFESPSNGHVFLNNLSATFPHWRVRSGGATNSTAATPTSLTGGNNAFVQTVGFLSRSGNTVESYENNTLAINGTDTANITTFSAKIGIGRLRYGGNVQEVIIWPTAQTDRADIQDNINTFYNIF